MMILHVDKWICSVLEPYTDEDIGEFNFQFLSTTAMSY